MNKTVSPLPPPFKSGSHCVAWAALELTIQARLALNSQQSSHFSLLSAGITSMRSEASFKVKYMVGKKACVVCFISCRSQSWVSILSLHLVCDRVSILTFRQYVQQVRWTTSFWWILHLHLSIGALS